MMGTPTIRIQAVLLPLILALACYSKPADGFGVSRSNFFTKSCASPRVQHIPVTPESTSVQALRYHSGEESSRKSRWYSQLNPIPKIRRKAAQWQPRFPGAKAGKRALLISVASVLVTLVARPTLALAMGGGMGGSKGPVAPMAR